jgi:hypothetical protein
MTLTDIQEKLQLLKSATNELLEQLTKERMAEVPFRRGGINWADLKCCNVEYIVNIYDEIVWRVTIDEVSPDEQELQDYVRNGLIERFDDVEVVTEW